MPIWRTSHSKHFAGFAMNDRAARFIAMLTEQLGCRVLVRPSAGGDALLLHLLGTNGAVLAVPAKRGRLTPITVAVVPDDPSETIGGYLEAVPQYGIGYGGSVSGADVQDTATVLSRHYRRVVDPTTAPWTEDTPWQDAPAHR